MTDHLDPLDRFFSSPAYTHCLALLRERRALALPLPTVLPAEEAPTPAAVRAAPPPPPPPPGGIPTTPAPAPREDPGNAFQRELAAYADERVTAAPARFVALLDNLKRFPMPSEHPAFVVGITVGQSEGIVDVANGSLVDGAFVRGAFSGTFFELDTLRADRAKYPVLRSDTRVWGADKGPAVLWGSIGCRRRPCCLRCT